MPIGLGDNEVGAIRREGETVRKEEAVCNSVETAVRPKTTDVSVRPVSGVIGAGEDEISHDIEGEVVGLAQELSGEGADDCRGFARQRIVPTHRVRALIANPKLAGLVEGQAIRLSPDHKAIDAAVVAATAEHTSVNLYPPQGSIRLKRRAFREGQALGHHSARRHGSVESAGDFDRCRIPSRHA